MLFGINANQLATGNLERQLGDFSGVFLLVGGGVDQLNLPLIVLFSAVERFLIGFDGRGVLFRRLSSNLVCLSLGFQRIARR